MKPDCPEGDRWAHQLSALLDGEDATSDLADLWAHLEHCRACSAWLEHVTALNDTLRRLPVVEPRLGERVVDAVDVHLCGCRQGDLCACGNCQCGPHCTCHARAG